MALVPLPLLARLLGVVLLGVSCQGPDASPDAASGPPNIVYILADDLGYGELGCYGQEKIRTPNIDRLATEGMLFTQHYSGAAVCAPSRCVLLTGLHTGHSFIRDNDEMDERGDVWNDPDLEGQRPIPAATVTLGELLQEQGYATGAVGKWGLGWTGSEGDPVLQGFDLFYGYNCQREAHNYYPTHLWRNQDKVPLDNQPFRAHQRFPKGDDAKAADAFRAYRGADYAPDFMIETALGFVREHQDEPFFLYYPSPIPHLALQIPDDEVDAYPASWDSAPYLGEKGYLPHARPRAAYAAMITRLDAEVGALLDLLDELGLADNTLVVFSSDNGPSWVGGVDREFFASSGGLRGRKAQLYEGGIRVPMIARWPGRIRAGSRSDHVSAFWDVLPTLCEVAAAPLPQDLDGISFLPTLLGRGQQPQHTGLYWEHERSWQAYREGPWKLMRRTQKLPLELYNLEQDPSESTELSGEMPDFTLALERRMEAARSPSELFPLRDR